MVANVADAPIKLKGKFVAVDCETNGLDVYHGDKIFCWAYFTEKGEYGYMRRTPANIQWLKRLMNNRKKTIIFHNAKFDLEMFLIDLGIDVFECKAKVHCTMMMNKVIDSTGLNHKLEYLAPKYLGIEDKDKVDIKDWVKANNTKKLIRERGGVKVNFSDAPDDLVIRRVLWDVEQTMGLFVYLWPKVQSTCPSLYETERQLMYVCIDMQRTGVEVDLTRCQELKDEAQSALDRITKDLDKLVLPLTYTRMVKDKKTGEKEPEEEEVVGSFNPNSSALQVPAAFRKAGIDLKYKTKPKKNKKTGRMSGGGNWAFDEYAMVRYVPKDLAEVIRDSSEEGWKADKYYKAVWDMIKKKDLDTKYALPTLILQARQLSKMISTYYNAILSKAVDVYTTPSGRRRGILHCRFNQDGAMTGRFSSSDPNLQNIPRIMGPRECFIVRKGRRNWHLDYSQVEMRMYCHFAEDRGMAKAIDNDVHLYVATKIYKKPRDQVTKEQRKRAKATGFGILYGSGAKTQAETLTKKGLPTTEMEAATIIAKYHREFPSVRKITGTLNKELRQNGYVENPFGRRYHVNPKFGYKMLNYMCQGTSADIIKVAMVKLWHYLRDNELKSKMLLTVHDEVVLEIPRTEELQVLKEAKRIMEDHTSYFVPIIVDAECNFSRWSEKVDAGKVGVTF